MRVNYVAFFDDELFIINNLMTRVFETGFDEDYGKRSAIDRRSDGEYDSRENFPPNAIVVKNKTFKKFYDKLLNSLCLTNTNSTM